MQWMGANVTTSAGDPGARLFGFPMTACKSPVRFHGRYGGVTAAGRDGEVVCGRFGAFEFAEPRFGWPAAM